MDPQPGPEIQAESPRPVAPDPADEAPEPRYGGFWIRLGAYLLDGLILNVVNLLLVVATLFRVPWLGLAWLVLGLVSPLAYFAFFWSRSGSTPGMRLLGLRVLDARSGNPVGLGRALWRFVAFILASFPFMIGLLVAAWDRQKRGWHDRLARTVVVRRPSLAEEGRGGRRLLVIFASVLGGVAVIAYIGTLAVLSTRLVGIRDAAGHITEPGDVLYSALRAGDCFDQPESDTFLVVHGIPCDAPHTFEVFRLVKLEADSYPTAAEMLDLARQNCLPAFEGYVGISFEASTWFVNYLAPAPEAWTQGDRRMLCVLQNETQTHVSGSGRQSSR